jgi:hypothetical protein
MKSLEHLISKQAFESLPANWNSFDLGRFSRGKALWKYQQDALKGALSVLWKYYEDFEDYVPGADLYADRERREKLASWYEHGMHLTPKERKSLNLSLKKAKRALRLLLEDYFPLDEEEPIINFQSICNRMGFWMATGSGKTIVLVKLLELLHHLMRREEIPRNDILMLTHREDLIEQFRKTVDEFNGAPDAPVHIELCELREYPEAKRDHPGGLLGRDSTLRVFYYRSDNLSDEHKERIIDFRNYDNDGRWYVLLDEAHKGDSADSKRKHLYAILTRQGFLFNFSATFTDVLDLATTVSNFNLSQFIGQGYGKHIAILKQELAAFKRRGGGGDYTDDEKRKVVAKSMILLAFTAAKVREARQVSGDPGFYHHPMLLTLVNSVNTEDADLKIYFEQILAIGRGQLPDKVWKEAKDELWEELKDEPEFLYEDLRKVSIARADLDKIGERDVWKDVYNFDGKQGGDIEVLVRPGNKQELAFKMKTSAKPFALIRIGDVTGWIKQKLSGFDFIETLETESFFKTLNDADSPFNILMGSRSFYEGWDSNRPNVLNFVNIGTGDDAKKFILQSVGRGVRVQSWKGDRRRFEELHEEFDDRQKFRAIKPVTVHPETLYILGTNRDALNVVLQELKKEKPANQQTLLLQLNPAVSGRRLLVPEYRDRNHVLMEDRTPAKFEIAGEDISLLTGYADSIVDDRVMLCAHGADGEKVDYLRKSLEDQATYYGTYGRRPFRNLEVMVGRVMGYFGLRSKELSRIRDLADQDIVHFKHMSVDKEHAEAIQRKIDQVLRSQTPAGLKAKETIEKRYKQGELDLDGLVREMEDQALTGRANYNEELGIEYLAQHYYLPTLYSTKGRKLDYLRHIIDVESETKFLGLLLEHVKKPENNLKGLDWWMFAKLDQYLDVPFLPYYSPFQNRMAKFIPDFIFWARKGSYYRILFVDPKGMENQEWERKAEGFSELFEKKGKPRAFEIDDMKVEVHLCLFTRDRNPASEGGYKRFWKDSIPSALESLTVLDRR